MKVRYYGHVGMATGYGRAAADMCMALLTAGVELEIRPLLPAKSVLLPEQYLPLASLLRREHDLDQNPDVVIVHTLPGDCKAVLDHLGYQEGQMRTGPRLVAYTTWETNRAPPETHQSLAWFDQIWSPSEVSAKALTRRVDGSPVSDTRVMPHCFDPASMAFRRRGPMRKPRERFCFYYVGAWTVRKNPEGIIRAFTHAFTAKDPVELQLQCHGAPQAVMMTDVSSPKMTLGTGFLSDAAILEMHEEADCFVSTSSGEAWNLPAFDAMLAGRHLIVPANQGSEEFLRGTSADRHMNLLDLASYMESVARLRVRDLTVGYNPVERFGHEAVGKLALSYLENR